MITDKASFLTLQADGVTVSQTFSATAGTTNQIDLGNARIDLGTGQRLRVVFSIAALPTTGGGDTFFTSVTFAVRGAAAANMSSAVVLGSSRAYTQAEIIGSTAAAVSGANPANGGPGYPSVVVEIDPTAFSGSALLNPGSQANLQDGTAALQPRYIDGHVTLASPNGSLTLPITAVLVTEHGQNYPHRAFITGITRV